MNRFFEFASKTGSLPFENGAFEDLQGLIQAAAESMHLQRMKLQADGAQVDMKDVATVAVAD